VGRFSCGFDPDLDLKEMGYSVLAFVTLEITQAQLHDVARELSRIPEVLEVHSITGPGDLLCRVVARTNSHLQHVINRILHVPGIGRSSTQIALTQHLRHRVLPIVELVINGAYPDATAEVEAVDPAAVDREGRAAG
jgi:DNA-binding Lrp family transcriptional regulator